MRLGYVRVSSADQSTARQEGLDAERTFTDKASAKDADRPALQELLSFAREGDVVTVHSLDRLARSLADLERIVSTLVDNGVTVEFVKEGLTFRAGRSSPTDLLLLQILGSIAQFERSLIRERQAEGIQSAKQRGVYRGRAPALSQDALATLREQIRAGVPVARAARELGVGRNTAFRALKAAYTPREEWAT